MKMVKKKHWAYLLMLALFSAAAAEPEELLQPASPGGAFLVGEELQFNPALEEDCNWELLSLPDFKSIRTGTVKYSEPLRLEPLPRGYYILRIPAGDLRFAVLPDPEQNNATAESFFALDAALSVLVREEDAEKAVELARRSGVKCIRDRTPNWAKTEKERGKIDFGAFERRAKLFAGKGIQILSVYHSVPAWSHTIRPDNRMPDDLMALYEYSREVSSHFKGIFPALEFWNESDYSGVDSVWDYAACLKTASLGYHAGNPGAQVLNGGFAIEAGDLPYHHVLMKNGAGYYFDVLALHSYGGISGYPLFLKKAFHFLNEHDCGGKPVWYTETGCRAEGKALAPFANHIKEHTPEQELLIAEFLVKQMISAQYCGVKRNFYFSLYPCNEEGGAKAWGLLRNRTLEVKAGFVAFATLISELGNAVPEGALKNPPPGIAGYAYRQPDGSRTLVVWQLSENDRRLHEEGLTFADSTGIPFPIVGEEDTVSAINLFGTPLPAGEMTVGRLPIYIRNAPVQEVIPPVRQTGTQQPSPEVDRTVVFQLFLPKEVGIVDEEGPWKSKPRQRADFRKEQPYEAKLRIYNFDNHEKTGSIRIAGAKWNTPASEEFTIPPMGQCEFPLQFQPEEARGEIVINGSFDGKEATPLLMPYRMKRPGEGLPEPRLLSDSGWRAVSAGNLAIALRPEENSVEFHTWFADTVEDRWSYPQYSLSSEETLDQAKEITFELALDSNRDDVRFMLILAHFELGGRQDLSIPLPEKTGEFTQIRIPLDELRTPEKVTSLSLGGNLKSGNLLAYRIRNLRIIYK